MTQPTRPTLKPEQIPLDLGHRNAMGRTDFMIAPSNEAAVAWIDRWPNWPAPALILYGPPASGKTHLGAVWQDRAGSKGYLVDDVQEIIGNQEKEEKLFHLYNQAREDNTHLLMMAELPPRQWDFILPDLASRLRAAPSVEIQPPDDTLLAAMLIKLFNDRQLHIGTDVLNYILPRIERSYDAARDLVEKADHQALAGKRAVTIPLLSRLL
jgi:chromosomal replication initiation ATPase DnaA